jgi:hypothetical protein
MKTRVWIFVVLLLLVSLTACQSATPTVGSTQPTSNSEIYPAPTVEPASSMNAYPAPTGETASDVGSTSVPSAEPAMTGPGSASVLYPDPQSGDNVLWTQAEAMILNGEVAKITRDGELQITIDLKDGRSLIVKGTSEKIVQQLLESCGDTCKNIQLAP